jgi:hypothetical protein
VTSERRPPLAFVDEYGQANLDADEPDVGPHFILTAVLVDEAEAGAVRAAVEEVRARHFQTGELRSKRLAKNPARFRQVLEELAPLPFKFYAVVVDKREIHADSALAFKDSFYEFLSGLLYRKLFDAFPNLHVTADEFGREDFMEDFARYLVANHRDTLFDRPRVTFAASKNEPLVQLADVVCGALARTYDSTKTTERTSELLGLIRADHALLIDEWPVRYRAASGTGSIVAGDPADDDLARYSIARAERFIEEHEGRIEEGTRAQLVTLKKLLYELRFGDPRTYIPTQVLRETLEAVGESHSDQWLRSTVIAQLRDAGVLIASSPQGYKIPVAMGDVRDFVAVTDTVVHPMLNRVARAREAVLLITRGRVDVLAGDRFSQLRAAVDAIRSTDRKPAPDE